MVSGGLALTKFFYDFLVNKFRGGGDLWDAESSGPQVDLGGHLGQDLTPSSRRQKAEKT